MYLSRIIQFLQCAETAGGDVDVERIDIQEYAVSVYPVDRESKRVTGRCPGEGLPRGGFDFETKPKIDWLPKDLA